MSFDLNLHLNHLNEIGQLQKEVAELNYFISREQDFWEWYEEQYGESRKELFEKFEKQEVTSPIPD
jgi:hypothetical protein